MDPASKVSDARVKRSIVIIPPLLLEYYEAKIQWHIRFLWKAAAKMLRYVNTQIITA